MYKYRVIKIEEYNSISSLVASYFVIEKKNQERPGQRWETLSKPDSMNFKRISYKFDTVQDAEDVIKLPLSGAPFDKEVRTVVSEEYTMKEETDAI